MVGLLFYIREIENFLFFETCKFQKFEKNQ